MSRSALQHYLHWHDRDGDRSVLWPMLAAILFVVGAAISCVVDQSVTMSSLGLPPPPGAIGR